MLETRQVRLDLCEERLDRTMDRRLQMFSDRLSKAAASLEALSPLSILSRGYTLTETTKGGRIRRASDIKVGDTLRTRFVDGVIESQCTSSEPQDTR